MVAPSELVADCSPHQVASTISDRATELFTPNIRFFGVRKIQHQLLAGGHSVEDAAQRPHIRLVCKPKEAKL